jgi:hypothetical protein
VALTALRLLVGLMWLWNVVWKVPPDSGENKKDGLYFWTRLGVDFRVFAPFRWLLEHLVLPNFTPGPGRRRAGRRGGGVHLRPVGPRRRMAGRHGDDGRRFRMCRDCRGWHCSIVDDTFGQFDRQRRG